MIPPTKMSWAEEGKPTLKATLVSSLFLFSYSLNYGNMIFLRENITGERTGCRTMMN